MRIRILAGSIALCLPLIALAQAPNLVDAAYFGGMVKELPEKKPGKLSADADDALQFSWEKKEWKTPYTQIKTIYISLSRQSALIEVFGLAGAAAGAMKKRKLLLSLILSDERGEQRRCTFFLPLAAPPEFIAALEKKSGRKVVYESEEARLAIEERGTSPPQKND